MTQKVTLSKQHLDRLNVHFLQYAKKVDFA